MPAAEARAGMWTSGRRIGGAARKVGVAVRTASAGALVLVGVAACAGPGSGRAPSPGGPDGEGGLAGGGAGGAVASEWVREVTPFQVLDRAGTPYEHPFLGGFDVPRPQLVDIDGDGDLDLFIQERSNELMFLENVGTPEEARFVWRTDRYADVDIAEWYRFVDLDRDGKPDLMAEQPFSYIRYYHNVGTPTAPRFEVGQDTLRTEGGEPLFSDRQNIPNATDLDGDGLTDLFVGHLSGTVARYELVEGSLPDPVFRLVTERFENIEIVTNVIGSMRHGANTMDFADFDGDGDVDLFWGDFFEPGLLLLENTGTATDPRVSNAPVPFPPDDPVTTTGYNAPTVGDLNGDGRPDMLIGVLGGAYNPTRSATENLYYLEQTPETFEVRTRRFLSMIDMGSESVPELVDLDGDGDLDLLVGSKIEPDRTSTGLVHVFENIGTAERPAFREAEPLPVEGSYHYAPAAVDLDGDGLTEIVLGTWNDELQVLRNAGTAPAPEWVQDDGPLVELTRGSHTTPAFGDVDGDGDPDLVVGEASGTLNFYRNAGTPEQPRFELVSDEWLDIDVGRRSHPMLVDVDGDGDLDLVVGNEDGHMHLFLNQGTPTAPEFVEVSDQAFPGMPYAAPVLADLDGDGVMELVMGSLSGGLAYYRRR